MLHLEEWHVAVKTLNSTEMEFLIKQKEIKPLWVKISDETLMTMNLYARCVE